MRIRKNAKLSPLLYTCSSSLLKNGSFPVETFQTHVCQLNQSPWDVIPFHSNNSIQFEDEDTFKTRDFHRAFDESVASKMETEDADINKPPIENFNTTALEDDNIKKVVNSNGADKGLKSDSIAAGPPRRGRGRPKKAVGSSSNNNNNEFYYYSGFGPLWGKRRGDSDNKNGDNGITLGSSEDKVKVNDGVGVGVNAVPCYSAMEIEGLDYVDDYDYDDYGDDDNGKRRMRKPVKERSLKSLM
ncbi:unnamed protein product [Lathyrus sativus]|nr:unnamed protein product [Lathyrus sativus]